MPDMSVSVRVANECDLTELLAIEQHCFNQDRLSARSLKHAPGPSIFTGG